ncbi:MAG TPA: DUF4337 family protein [Solirubrobacteraceae bacterium]|jgi:hypothetical protein|nr:DUF4337 family protein [Solirubrobacteraceae bacterium]
MKARKSLEHAEAMEAGPVHVLVDPFARRAAVMIAVLAGLLAISTLLVGEAVKESINDQTRSALARTLAETNAIKAFVGTSAARELGLLAGTQTSPHEAQALRHAARLDDQVARTFGPRERVLVRRAAAKQATHEDEDEKHFRFEFASSALEIGIVLGSIAIITHLRWLVGGGILAGMVGIGFIVAGLLV